MPKKARSASLDNIFVSDAHRLIYTEISYLKRRIHLVEGERKANYESNEENLKHNEAKVKEIKRKNLELKHQRNLMLKSRETFIKEISTRLGGEKKAYEFKDKKFEDVVDILECKIGTLRNKQNYLKYNKIQQEKQMTQVVLEEDKLQKLVDGKGSKHDERKLHSAVQKRLDNIKSTETSTAAMLMKITEADNIRGRYKNMASLLKSENFELNIKMAENDRKIAVETSEILRTRTVLQESLKAKKLAKVRLAKIEETTIKDYSEREKQLFDARMQLKTIREKMEQIGSKLSFPKFHTIHRDSSTTDLYVGYQNLDEKRESKTQNLIESVYNQLSNIIGETDPSIIVTRFQAQRDHAKELKRQEEVAKSSVRKAKLLKRFLLDKLCQLQFSGGLKRENLRKKFTLINVQVENTVSERDRLNKWIDDHLASMNQMLQKIYEICNVNDFKPPATTSNIPAANVVTLLRYILKQLSNILGTGLVELPPSPIHPSTPLLHNEEKDNLFELTEPSFNLPSPGSSGSFRLSITDLDGFTERIDTPDPRRNIAPSIMHENYPEKREDIVGGGAKGKINRSSSEDEEPVSRNIVKRQSQLLYETKTRKGRFNAGGATGGSAARKKY